MVFKNIIIRVYSESGKCVSSESKNWFGGSEIEDEKESLYKRGGFEAGSFCSFCINLRIRLYYVTYISKCVASMIHIGSVIFYPLILLHQKISISKKSLY